MRGYQYLKTFLYSAVDPTREIRPTLILSEGLRSGRASHAGKYGRQGGCRRKPGQTWQSTSRPAPRGWAKDDLGEDELLSVGVQQFDAVIVGAGFGGMGAAIQLNRSGYDNFVILDREDDLGGTWHVNRYPGLAVDVPSTTYSYWFEPNPYWSRLYAPGAELKRYAEHVADKYDVRRYMRFNTTVEGARWDEDAQHLAGRARRWRDAERAVSDRRDGLPVSAEAPRTFRASMTFAGRSSTPRNGTTATTSRDDGRRSSEPARPACSSFPSWPRRSPS